MWRSARLQGGTREGPCPDAISRRRPLAPVFTALIFAASLGGCALGPEKTGAGVAIPAGFENAARAPARAPELERWWTRFGSPELTQLVERASASNFDVSAAAARLQQADAQAVPPELGAGWLVVLESPTPAEPLAGDSGRLLDNMLRAMRLHRHPRTFVATLNRHAPGLTAEGLEPAAGLQQALQTLRPSLVLVLGLGAARVVLGSREPLGRLRATAHHLPDGTPAVVSYDPAYLLRAPDAKAAAWADLCRALALVRRSTAP